MGCAQSRPTSVVPGPPTAAVRVLKRSPRSRFLKPLGWTRHRGKRFTREQRQLIKKHLPSIPIYEHSTPAHLTIAARHWGDVYKEGSTSMVSKRSQGSWGRETKTTSPLRDLYDTFYEYLETHSPALMPVFRASLQVRSKVLVHISAGMRSILASPNAPEKIAQLTHTHLRVGVQLEHFNPLAVALFYAMQKTSGAFWTGEVEEAWRRLFVHCASLLMVEQKKALTQTLKSSKSNSHLSVPTPFAEVLRAPMRGVSIREHSSGLASKTSVGGP